MKHFKIEDFICRCEACNQERLEQFKTMNPQIVQTLDYIRDDLDEPIYTTSGIRCPLHPLNANKLDGQLLIDNHLNGYAIDWKYKSMNNHPIIDAIKNNQDVEQFGIIQTIKKYNILRIGIAQSFIHIDNNPYKAPAIWIYD